MVNAQNTSLQGRDVVLQQRSILLVALFLVMALSLLSSIVNPIFEPPDELQHYQFVRYIVDNNGLPIQELSSDVPGTWRWFNQVPSGSGMHRQPLYYALASLLVAGIKDPEEIPQLNHFWNHTSERINRDNKQQYLDTASQAFPYRGTALVVHILRLWSVVLALGTVTTMWLLGITLWPNEPAKVAAMLSIGVMNPMFLYLSGSINNDNLIILCGTLCLWLSVRALRDNFAWSTTIFIGLVWGCALLSKLTGILLAVPWVISLILTARHQKDIRLFISRFATMFGIALALSGWWFIRHYLIYGKFFALPVMGTWVMRQQLGKAWIWHDIMYSWTTLWGRFAYGQVPLPQFVYWLLLLLFLVSIGGTTRQLVTALRHQKFAETRWSIWLVLSTTLFTYIVALAYFVANNPTGANSRYIHPALSAFASLFVYGISAWFAGWRRVALNGTVVIMIGVAIYSISIFLPWTYAKPRLVYEIGADTRSDISREIYWGDGIALAGTTISPQIVNPGEKVNLKACWRAEDAMTTDFVFYAHLLDRQFKSFGQRDTYTGLGTFPTSQWKHGDLFCDTYLIPVNEVFSLPTVVDIVIGFYDYNSRHQLPARTAEDISLAQVVVGQVKLIPKSPWHINEPQYRTEARFEQGIILSGYTWSVTEIRPGESISVNTNWKSSGPLDSSFTIFAHLLDKNRQMITQDDGLPRDGDYPTTFWGVNETIVDERIFTIPEGTTPGPSQLLLGFYRMEDRARLPREGNSDLVDTVILPGPSIVEP